MIDKIRERINALSEWIGKSKGLKTLVTEDGELKREFEANGKTYIIYSAEEVFNIDKSSAFDNLQRQFSSGKTPTEQYLDIQKTKDLLCEMSNKKTFNAALSSLWKHTINMEESFKSRNGKMPMGLYIASLFIYEKGKNRYEKFSYESAELKIKDWLEGNYRAEDFFLLALGASSEYRQIINA